MPCCFCPCCCWLRPHEWNAERFRVIFSRRYIVAVLLAQWESITISFIKYLRVEYGGPITYYYDIFATRCCHGIPCPWWTSVVMSVRISVPYRTVEISSRVFWCTISRAAAAGHLPPISVPQTELLLVRSFVHSIDRQPMLGVPLDREHGEEYPGGMHSIVWRWLLECRRGWLPLAVEVVQAA